ncbi:hypothetical protein OIV83_004527 [Microbotryomycetes sp. JL201]|nr:hypothetical protein OIV83_004527 [Microbotryomycetes sp. JL201]
MCRLAVQLAAKVVTGPSTTVVRAQWSRARSLGVPLTAQHLFRTRPTASLSTSSIAWAKRNKSNSKQKSNKNNDNDDEDEPDAFTSADHVRQRGSKHSDNLRKGKNKFAITTDDESNSVVVQGEPVLQVKFGLRESESDMANAVDRFKVNLKNVVDLLDGLKVELDGERRPLLEYASVSVKDGRDLLVTCYDESYVKAVSQAIYSSPHNFAPQTVSPTTMRVPVPKPNMDTRKQLVKQASDLSEQARTAIRGTRTRGHKDIKADVDGKLSSKDEGQKDGKKLDAATKKHTDEVDKILEQAKKILLDE